MMLDKNNVIQGLYSIQLASPTAQKKRPLSEPDTPNESRKVSRGSAANDHPQFYGTKMSIPTKAADYPVSTKHLRPVSDQEGNRRQSISEGLSQSFGNTSLTSSFSTGFSTRTTPNQSFYNESAATSFESLPDVSHIKKSSLPAFNDEMRGQRSKLRHQRSVDGKDFAENEFDIMDVKLDHSSQSIGIPTLESGPNTSRPMPPTESNVGDYITRCLVNATPFGKCKLCNGSQPVLRLIVCSVS